MVNRARVIGDRFDLLNGKICDSPGFDFFRPFVELLAPAEHAPVDTQIKTTFGLDETKADDWRREKDAREIASEKIASAFKLAKMDGKGADDQKARVELMRKYWGTTSWKELSERTPSAALTAGLRRFEVDHQLTGDDVEISAMISDEEKREIAAREAKEAAR
jgi:hypothetical protein